MKEKKKKRRTEEAVGSKKSGQKWTLPAQLGWLKTGKDGKTFANPSWCPDVLPSLWDRIEYFSLIWDFMFAGDILRTVKGCLVATQRPKVNSKDALYWAGKTKNFTFHEP